MPRSDEAEAYDKARIKYEEGKRRVEGSKRYLERHDPWYGSSTPSRAQASIVVDKYRTQVSRWESKDQYASVRKKDQALGKRMQDEYVQFRRTQLARETADQIARTSNYKYDDNYYKKASSGSRYDD